jgi:multidrug efflux pump subunit AcrA (membrane-fusion protein)
MAFDSPDRTPMDEPPIQSTAHPAPAAATESPHPAVLVEDDLLDLDAEFDADEEAWMPTAAWLSGPRGLLLGLGLGVVVTLGASFALGSRKPAAQPAVAAAEQPAGAVGSPQTPAGAEQPVTIATAEVASVSRTIEASGTIEARELVPVQPTSTGLRVLQILADEGQVVRQGQPLATVDDSLLRTQLVQARAEALEAEAALAKLRAGSRPEEIAQAREAARQAAAGVERARADLALSRVRVDRNQSLANEGAISRDRLDEVLTRARSDEAALEQARARLAEAQQRYRQVASGNRREDITQAEARFLQARGRMRQIVEQLKNTRVLAPAPGVVVKRNVTVGDVTANNQPLFQIAAVGKLELHLKVPETQLRTIRPGQPVQAIIDATKRVVNGRVREIDPVVDPQSRQATVKVELAPAPDLRKGMFLRAAIGVSAGRGLAIPAKALLPQPDGTAIAYRLNPDNTVTARRIEVGKVMADGRVEVRSGIEPGQGVVVKGAPYLKDGDRVRVMPN